jgi:hypothetical protein
MESRSLTDRFDLLNARLSLDGTLPAKKLENLFTEAVETAFQSDVLEVLETLRGRAFETGDFREVDDFAERAAPAITILSLGESVSVGVNTMAFLLKCAPGSAEREFFDLAGDGFYADGDTGIPGTAALPVWLERGDTSAQAVPIQERAAEYLEIWRRKLPEFSGFFLEMANETVAGLEKAAAFGSP